MRINTRQISPDTIEWFRKACENGDLSRRALALEFCAREQWLDYAGRPNRASASSLLRKLADRLGVCLPPVKGRPLEAHPRPSADYPDHAVSATIQELGTLSLVPVSDRDEGRLWESMLETHHPEGWRRAPGGLIQYWIVSRGALPSRGTEVSWTCTRFKGTPVEREEEGLAWIVTSCQRNSHAASRASRNAFSRCPRADRRAELRITSISTRAWTGA